MLKNMPRPSKSTHEAVRAVRSSHEFILILYDVYAQIASASNNKSNPLIGHPEFMVANKVSNYRQQGMISGSRTRFGMTVLNRMLRA